MLSHCLKHKKDTQNVEQKVLKNKKKMVKQCYHQDVLHVAVKLIFMKEQEAKEYQKG